jgi:hypothetical protein
MYDLKTAATAMTNFLIEQRGYDDARFYQVSLNEHYLRLELNLEDYFQSGLPFGDKYRSGYEMFSVEHDDENPIASIWKLIEKVPSREMREIHVLARQTSTTAAMAGKLKSAMASQFVLDIQKTRDTNLLSAA